MSDLYAVFGNPISHSLSPKIHAHFARETGENLRYEALLAPLDNFPAFLRDFAAQNAHFRGANITVPFKEEAFLLSNRRTARAELAGAVNTLSFSAEGILGDNTDGAGLLADIRDFLGVEITDKRILILGAGGATRGIIAPLLAENPAHIVIANRTLLRAEKLCDFFADDKLTSAAFNALAGRSFDLIINATAASLAGDKLNLPQGIFAPKSLAYEMMYGKNLLEKSAFCQQAQQEGAEIADGLGMLVEQAAEAFFAWRGVRPNTQKIREQLRA